MGKRILILSYHFYPDGAVGARRMSQLATSLAQRGDQITVIRGRSAPDIQPDPGLVEPVAALNVISVPVPPKIAPAVGRWRRRFRQGKKNTETSLHANTAPETPAQPGRLKRFYYSVESIVDYRKLWATLVAVRLCFLRLTNRVDVIISSGPPWSAYLPALLAKWLFGARWIIDLRDPFYQNPIWTEALQSPVKNRVESFLEGLCFSRADRIVCTAPGAARQVRERYGWNDARVPVIHNGYAAPQKRRKPPEKGRLNLLYAGMLYLNRDPFPLLHGLKKMLASPGVKRERVQLTFLGGTSWNGIDINDWLKAHQLADCAQALPRVHAEEMEIHQTQANVLVNLAQGQPDQIPAKTFEYLASGKETLTLTEPESDTGKLVTDTRSGRVVAGADSQAISDALGDLYRFYVTQKKPYRPDRKRIAAFSAEAQTGHYRILIDQVAGE